VATPNNSEAVDRLLKAWRGEVEAQAVYSILADREKDPQRRGIVREIAAGEARHRQRVEERLRELGQPLPDPSTVGVSTWKRLQARLAPIPRVMASMEAAEDEEIEDRYRRTTGDADTDKVLLAIRSEEQQHARSLRGLQAQIEGGPPPNAVQARLNRILGRERWHQTGAGWISGAIYGANDGLAAVFGIVAGVSGATGGSSFVLTAAFRERSPRLSRWRPAPFSPSALRTWWAAGLEMTAAGVIVGGVTYALGLLLQGHGG